MLRERADQMLEVIDVHYIQNLQNKLKSSSNKSDETLDEIQVNTNGRRQVDSSKNQEEPDIDISKDNLALGLSTSDKTLELSSRVSLLPPAELSSTLVKKKPHYEIVPTKEAKPKKKINGDIGEQNVITGKRIKKRS